MYDSDQMTNNTELDGLIGSLSGVSMPKPPPLDAVMARGRALRRHRRYSVASLFLVGACIAAALAIGPIDAPAAGPTATPASGLRFGAIRTAAYTIVLNSDGTATLTINPNELFDPARLQSDLDQYGIPARVTLGSFCSSDPAPAGLSRVVSYRSNKKATITINPKAMPAGTELSFGEFQLRMGIELATYALIDKGSYTCSNSPPTSSPSRGGLHTIGGWMRRD